MGTAKRERQKANRQKRLEEMQKEAQKKRTKKRALWIGGIVAAVVVLVFGVSFLSGDDDGDSAPTTLAPVTTLATTTTAPPPAFGSGECAPAEPPAEPVTSFEDRPAECIDPELTYTAVVETTQGSFTIELDAANAPVNVNNFVTLAGWGYYDAASCHRVITDFVVQCGAIDGDDAEEAPGYTVIDELPADGEYAEGVVAMANKSAPNTAGGQWFVIVGEGGASLPPAYTIIGRVTEGYDTTVAALEALADPAASNGVPTLEPIDIISVRVTSA